MLEAPGYEVREEATGLSGLGEVPFWRPDVIVLDLGLPDISGIEFLRRLREWNQTPVLVLSVIGDEESKVMALDSGADDYLTKPFSPRELLARIRVLERRNQRPEQPRAVRFGAVEIDFANRLVTRVGQYVRLTTKEYAFVRILALNAGKIVTHSQILREVWGPTSESQSQYLRVYMARLRQKLEDTPNEPKHLLNELGIGYRLAIEPSS
jgi:two-component system KDP operon response regulator KdpE